jgi:hypothetical protein
MNFFVIKNKKLANEEFVIYQKRTKDHVIIIHGSISGFIAKKSSKVIPKELLPEKDENNYIFEALGNSTFSREKKLIPEGYKKIRRTDKTFNLKWALSYYLQPYISPEKIALLNQEGYELEKWMQQYRKYWITIKDIEKLKPNKKIKLLVLDRNVWDDKNKFKKGKLYKPENFFVDNSAVYFKNNMASLNGKIKHQWQNNNEEPYNFEFEIEYKKNNWYPLTNGILPAEDEQGFSELLGEDKSWSEFSKNTHIGWRGPMILWDDLKKLKKVWLM